MLAGTVSYTLLATFMVVAILTIAVGALSLICAAIWTPISRSFIFRFTLVAQKFNAFFFHLRAYFLLDNMKDCYCIKHV